MPYNKEHKKRYDKEFRKENEERIKEYKKKWNLKNKERLKEYRLKNREYIREYKNKYMKEYNLRPEVKERVKKWGLEYRLKNGEYISEKKNEWYLKNIEHVKAKRKKWRSENRERNNEYERRYTKNKRKINPSYRIGQNLRKRTWEALRGNNKSAPTMELIGCTMDELWIHLESSPNWETWMTRENYGRSGGWDVDHIKPCCKFDLTDPIQQHACFHWSNLQPMEHIANIKKGSKIILGDITSPKM